MKTPVEWWVTPEMQADAICFARQREWWGWFGPKLRVLKAMIADAIYSYAERERQRLFKAVARSNHEIEQALGKALGYPWYKGDPKNFPDATEADGVCVGDHVPESLAAEAAARIVKQRQQIDALLLVGANLKTAVTMSQFPGWLPCTHPCGHVSCHAVTEWEVAVSTMGSR